MIHEKKGDYLGEGICGEGTGSEQDRSMLYYETH
jgi:hypothetical protein